MSKNEYWVRQGDKRRKAIALLHGIGAKDPQHYWQSFLNVLKSDVSFEEFDLFVWKYPTHLEPNLWKNFLHSVKRGTLRETNPRIKLLGQAWNTTYSTQFRGYEEVLLICHSMGGLVVKSWIIDVLEDGQSANLNALRHIAFYSTPHNGAPITTLTNWNNQLRDMQLDSPFIEDIGERWHRHVVFWKDKERGLEDHKFNLYIPQLVIVGINDSVVPPEFATIRGIRPTRVVGDHSEVIQPADINDTKYKVWHNDIEEIFQGKLQVSDQNKFAHLSENGQLQELQIKTNDDHTNDVAFISTIESETKSSEMPSRADTRETIDKSNPSKSLRKQTSLQIIASTVAIVVVIICTIISVRACSSGAFNPSYEEPLSTSPLTTPSIDTPSASLSPTNTPTLTTVTPGKILYYADWSNGSNGWQEAGGWKIYHKELLNDGTDNNSTDIEPTIVAPYTLGSVLNYAVEVRIKVDNYNDFPCFGIVVRNVGSQGYSVGMSCDMQFSTIQITPDLTGYNNALAQQPFNPSNAWHTYRIEVKDNTIKLFIDSNTKPLLQAIDNKYLSDGGQVGLWCHNAQLEISSFKIVAL
jgi:hypothetical protein